MMPKLTIAILTAFLPYAFTIGSSLWSVYIAKKCKSSRAALLTRDKKNQALAVERSEEASARSEEARKEGIEAELYVNTEENKNSFIEQVTGGKTLTIIVILFSVLWGFFLFCISHEEDWQKSLIYFLFYFNISMIAIGIWRRDRRVRTRLRRGLSEYIFQNRSMNVAVLKAVVGEALQKGKRQEHSYSKIILDKHGMEGENYWKDLMEHVME